MGLSYSRDNFDRTRYAEAYFEGRIPADSARGKTVAVTGATKNGLGLLFAKHAARLGASKIILLNRESERTAPAEAEVKEVCPPGVEVTTLICDLSSFASVRQTRRAFAACWSSLVSSREWSHEHFHFFSSHALNWLARNAQQ